MPAPCNTETTPVINIEEVLLQKNVHFSKLEIFPQSNLGITLCKSENYANEKLDLIDRANT